MTRTTIVWLENDLRLADHPALHAAAAAGDRVLPVFVWDGGRDWADGAASRWWLHHSLAALSDVLGRSGLPLVLRRGDPIRILPDLASGVGAARVAWNARPEPSRALRDRHVARALADRGIDALVHPGSLLHDPEAVRTSSGGPYQVFTPFHRRLSAELSVPAPLGDPAFGPGNRPEGVPDSADLDELGLLPAFDWAAGLRETWQPGEAGAIERLERFCDGAVTDYGDRRNRPDLESTSRLSPHLHFGEVTPALVWHRLRAQFGTDGPAEPFLRQVVWREFAFHLLHHFPDTPEQPLKPAFARMPWAEDGEALARWQRGRTGYPIVDAAMRELWHTGWMHNRTRMVVASFLTKDLLLPWTAGAAWFRDTLVDADLANNTFGWQWTAGCGADAQPFFRVFNPVRQGERFDPDGAYVRRWVPELARVPTRFVHAPWTAPADVLAAAGVMPGRTYPHPIVDHDEARRRALAAYEAVSGG